MNLEQQGPLFDVLAHHSKSLDSFGGFEASDLKQDVLQLQDQSGQPPFIRVTQIAMYHACFLGQLPREILVRCQIEGLESISSRIEVDDANQ